MALNGSFTGYTNNQYIQPKIIWTAIQSISGNYSDVTATLTYSRTNSGFTTSGKWVGSITINGTTTSGNSGGNQIYITQNSNTFAMSATTRVYHDNDGSKNITISASGNMPSASLSSTSISSTVTLDTIPRISVPTVSASRVNFGSNITIYTNRKSTVFTHRLWYKYGNTSWIEINPTASVGDSYVWTVPTDLMNQIPNSTTLSITIGCDTYYGGNYLGYEAVTFTALVPDTVVPVVGGISWTKTSGEPSGWGITQNVSQGTMAMTGVSGAYGSTILSYSLTFAGYSSAASSLSVPHVSSPGTFTAIAKVTDSRGRTSAEKKVDFVVSAYQKPQLSVIAYRSDGTAGNEDTSGEYLYLKATATVSPVGNNALKTLTLGYKRHDSAGSYTTVNLTNGTARITALSSDYSWDWVVTASDVVSTVTQNGSISTGEVILDILANGKGIGLGKVAEKEGLDSAWDFMKNGVAQVDFVTGQGTSGIWTYRKWASGIAECWGLYDVADWDISTAWGYIYESQAAIATDLPSGLFIDVPVFNMSVQNSTAGILSLETVSNVNKDMTCYIYPTRATPGKVSLTIAMRAIGRWK